MMYTSVPSRQEPGCQTRVEKFILNIITVDGIHNCPCNPVGELKQNSPTEQFTEVTFVSFHSYQYLSSFCVICRICLGYRSVVLDFVRWDAETVLGRMPSVRKTAKEYAIHCSVYRYINFVKKPYVPTTLYAEHI